MSWLSLRGRIGRQTYWLGYILPLVVASVVLSSVGYTSVSYMKDIGGTLTGIANILLLLLIWPGIAGMVKRLHDRGRSGGWAAASFVLGLSLMMAIGMGFAAVFGMGAQSNIAVTFGVIAAVLGIVTCAISLWLFIELGFLRGTLGWNAYGPDPLAPGMPPPGPYGYAAPPPYGGYAAPPPAPWQQPPQAPGGPWQNPPGGPR